jgi:ABC-type Zn uptake system ZnuABC Zn-binding protein ZnuA
MGEKMKQIQKYILLILALTLLLPAVITNAETENITIICTNSVLADFTSNILKENVTIEYVMPAGACPSHFDTSPSDVSLIASADIVISLGWEPWLEDLLNSSGNLDVDMIKCSKLGEWNLPSNAKKYVEKIRDELVLIRPDQNETVNSNAQTYLNQINETADGLTELIQNNEYMDKKIICMQWQEDFLEWLGFNITYSYPPPESLSTQDELEVINAASSGEVNAVVDNLQSGTDFGARVASESGASHVIFTNFPNAIPGTDTYLEMITYNTQQLINGIETYEYKQGDIANLENEIIDLEWQRNVSLLLLFIFAISTITLIVLYKKK